MLAANGVARAARVAIPLARGTRNMSGHGSPEEIYQSKEMWLKVSVLALGFIITPYLTAVLYLEATHHHEEKTLYPHMHIMNRPFPWKESDCALFDIHCKHEWHAAHKGGAAAAHH